MKYLLIIILTFFSSCFQLFSTFVDLGDPFISDSNPNAFNRGKYSFQQLIDLNLNSNFQSVYINSVFGNLIYERTDFISNDISFPIIIKFTYNSGSSNDGRYGLGWQFNYNIRYITNDINKKVIITQSDDRSDIFKFLGDNKYSPTLDCIDSLIKTKTGYQLIKYLDKLNNSDYSVYNFNSDKHYYITQISDMFNNQIRFLYKDYQLISIIFPSGRKIDLEYISEDLLSHIYFDSKLICSYQYQNHLLKKVVYPDGKFIEYGYLNDCSLLNSIITNDTRVINFDYNENMQVEVAQIPSTDFNLEMKYEANRNEITDGNGLTTVFKYDSLFRTTSITDAKSNITKLLWDTNYQLISKQFPDNSTWKYEYQNKFLSKIIYPNNSFSVIQRNTADKGVVSIDNSDNSTIKNNFDLSTHSNTFYDEFNNKLLLNRLTNGLINKIVFNETQSSSITYGNFGEVTNFTNPMNFIKLFKYNSFNQLTQYQNEDSLVYQVKYNVFNYPLELNYPGSLYKKFNYNLDGKIEKISINDKAINSLTYDSLLRIKAIKYYDKNIYFFYSAFNIKIQNLILSEIAMNFDSTYSLSSILLPLNLKKTFVSNSLNQRAEIIDFNNEKRNLKYDYLGNIVEERTKYYTKLHEYDNFNRIKSLKFDDYLISLVYLPDKIIINHPLNLKFTLNLNNINNMSSLDINNVLIYKYDYDLINRITKITNHSNQEMKMDYRNTNKLSSISDFYNNKYFFAYNNNLLISKKYPNGLMISYNYDLFSRIISISDNYHDQTNYFYNTNNLIDKVLINDNLTYLFSYNSENNPTKISLNGNMNFIFNYDSLNRISNYIDETSKNFIFKYDLLSNFNSISINDFSTIKFNFNTLSQLDQIIDPIGNTVNFEYNLNLSKIILPKNSNYSFLRDNLGRIVTIYDPLNFTKVFAYDFLGNITKEILGGNAIIQEYSLWDLNKVTFNNLDSVIFQRFRDENLSIVTDFYKTKHYFSFGFNGQILWQSIENDTVFYNYNLLSQKSNIRNNNFNIYYNYNILNQLNQIISNGFSFDIEYVLFDKIRSMKLNNMPLFNFNYNNGLISNLSDYKGRKYSLFYNEKKELIELRNSQNYSQFYSYDNLGRLISNSFSDGTKYIYNYDSDGNIIRITNPQLLVQNYQYDKLNNLTSIKYNRNDSIMITHNYNENKLGIIDPNQNQYSLNFDYLTRLKSVLFPENSKISFDFKNNSKSIIKIGKLNDSSIIKYNQYLQIVNSLTPLKNIFQFDYFGSGLQVSQKFNSYIFSSTTYDEDFKLITNKFKTITSTNQYVSDFKIDISFENSIKHNFNYNTNNLVDDIILTNGNYSELSYNKIAFINELTDNKRYKYSYFYDLNDKLNTINYPNVTQLKFNFNSNDQLQSFINANDEEIKIIYDNRNFIKKIMYPQSSEFSFYYDSNGNLIILEDFIGNQTDLRYNTLNQLTNIKNLDNAISLNYENGNLSRIESTGLDNDLINIFTDKDNRFLGYKIYFEKLYPKIIDLAYNSSNLISSIKASDFDSVKYNYQNNNQFIQINFGNNKNIDVNLIDNKYSHIIYPNGFITDYFYNDLNQLTSLIIKNNSNQIVNSLKYKYDANGNLISISKFDTTNTLMEYDSTNQIKRIINNDTLSYYYDNNGNRKAIGKNGIVTQNILQMADQLIKEGDLEFNYDDAGNVLTLTDKDSIYQMIYDNSNRISGIILPNKTNLEFKYSSTNKLITITNQEKKYLLPLDIRSQADNFNMAEFSSKFNPLRINIPLLQENKKPEVLAYKDVESNKFYYLHKDVSGNLINISDEDGNIIYNQNMNAYGYADSTSLQYDYIFQNMNYIGNNLYINNDRIYDSRIGRYYQRKSNFNNTLNPYIFSQNNPYRINYNEPNFYDTLKLNQDYFIKDYKLLLDSFSFISSHDIISKCLNRINSSYFNNFKPFDIRFVHNSFEIKDLINKNFQDPVKLFKKLLSHNTVLPNEIEISKAFPSKIIDSIQILSVDSYYNNLSNDNITSFNETNPIRKIIHFMKLVDDNPDDYIFQIEKFMNKLDTLKNIEMVHSNITKIHYPCFEFNNIINEIPTKNSFSKIANHQKVNSLDNDILELIKFAISPETKIIIPKIDLVNSLIKQTSNIDCDINSFFGKEINKANEINRLNKDNLTNYLSFILDLKKDIFPKSIHYNKQDIDILLNYRSIDVINNIPIKIKKFK